MHIAIDDTYGPKWHGRSRYVTGDRRTYVGVVFEDEKVDFIREQITECLGETTRLIGTPVDEFHFADIYNRNKIWNTLAEGLNLRIFEFFADIYSRYRWRVWVQTLDKRTFRDLKDLTASLTLDGLNPKDPADVALSMLCLRLRIEYKRSHEPLTIILDEGRRKLGHKFGDELFVGWPVAFAGYYASSISEPLLQIADFIAFCVNRSTHLSLKEQRTERDRWFLELFANMRVNSNDLTPMLLSAEFTTQQFDEFHRVDRQLKGLQD